MTSGSALGALPEWNLGDLYSGPDAQDIRDDIERATAAALAFSKRYKGGLSELDGTALGEAIAEYERIDEILSRIGSYAQLVYAADQSDPANGRFYQGTHERLNTIATELLFFTLELNRLEDTHLDALEADATLVRYEPWLRDVRTMRPHQLDDEIERVLHEKHVVGRAAWIRLFDQLMAGLRFPFRDKELTEAEILNLMSDPDRDTRRDAATSLGAVLGANIQTLALVTNTLAKDKEIEDGWRKFARPDSSRNLFNFVEDEVVDALSAAVRNAYPDLSHRYYALKAKWFGSDRLDYWDRNAPLPDSDDRIIAWDEARQTVLDAYGAFSPDLADVGRRFFDNAWIDAPVRPGKASGAFAHPTVPSAHPYLLLNYQGKTRDVMTLAHELGHGVHQVLAGGQGHLMADTPLTLAETASVFGEMLTFRAMLKQTENPSARRAMLAGKAEDMLNTVVRQIAFYEFERRVHGERREGELLPERLGEIWMDVQSESLGPALRFDENYRVFWGYIPHFVHSPFYVYAYAFGDCLVNSLYAAYQDAETGFADRYLAMLRAGGTLRHKELLEPFGLDATDPDFWNRGLRVISGLIDELEALS
ncbi:MAG: M3 family oligoendopeptidase [Rhodospirillales bacterium]|nr:MAG: M3 family oligoendopeptidase [Rhodospirillales bacterium]